MRASKRSALKLLRLRTSDAVQKTLKLLDFLSVRLAKNKVFMIKSRSAFWVWNTLGSMEFTLGPRVSMITNKFLLLSYNKRIVP